MSQENNKILVVGATGTVGSVLVEALVAAGEQVRAGTRDPRRDLGAGVEAVLYDFDDPDTFSGALDGVDRIFYLTRRADVQAAAVAAPLFERAAAAGVRHIVNMSAMGVDADDNIPLRQVEILLENSGVPCTLLRPNWFMQNFSTGSYGDMVRGGGIFLPAADASVSFIDIRDIAAVAAKALTEAGHAGKAYTLTGPESYTFGSVMAKFSETSQREIQYVPTSDADLATAMEAQGMPDSVTQFMVGLFGAVRAGYFSPVTPDVGQILGRPARDLSAFAAELASV